MRMSVAERDYFEMLKEDWNTYEVLAVGHKIQTAINGQKCVDLDDPQGELKGHLAVQVHAGGPTEVRFKDFQLELNPEPKLKTSTISSWSRCRYAVIEPSIASWR